MQDGGWRWHPLIITYQEEHAAFHLVGGGKWAKFD